MFFKGLVLICLYGRFFRDFHVFYQNFHPIFAKSIFCRNRNIWSSSSQQVCTWNFLLWIIQFQSQQTVLIDEVFSSLYPLGGNRRDQSVSSNLEFAFTGESYLQYTTRHWLSLYKLIGLIEFLQICILSVLLSKIMPRSVIGCIRLPCHAMPCQPTWVLPFLRSAAKLEIG